ncbi:Pyridine nucleotide-disulfide oxidoreductase, FAD/NAD(P)-binding domain protein [Niveomyces insectorum RCEF 264]|uniref:Pyridine nucleotide-disulfide oxidoreductase, FAD/NAD(P)-binding domain protein n=1 Tax=Niveomyces insectorum RCEF 264 TaxID=1081102 RepID=A0A168AGP5_9HYPO|nr:Pyridine nucleotide-disulfide oxidoreductase, FAD/NAD(P)-binding domain protein [Niveomyces insectorum RCEF 264]
MTSRYKNLVVVGGSYVGTNVAQQLAARFHDRFRVVLIEKNSHFHHLFAFPRFAVTNDAETQKAFIPYLPGTFAAAPAGAGTVLQARAVDVTSSSVKLDRTVSLDNQQLDAIPYAFLVLATGTDAVPPSRMPAEGKQRGVEYLRRHAQDVALRSKIVIVGGGAVGVQMATDLKDLYPDKSVTIVHSRPHLMNRFDVALDKIVQDRCAELGVRLKLGMRVKLPRADYYPTDGRLFDVECEDGTQIPADFAIVANGLAPQSGILRSLTPASIDADGYVRVLGTLQIRDPKHPNIFAVGDIAATGAAKAARPGAKQAETVVNNIDHILKGEVLEEYDASDPPAIHLTLGIKKNVIFRNPVLGSSEHFTKDRDDGALDMNIDSVWTRRGGGKDSSL